MPKLNYTQADIQEQYLFGNKVRQEQDNSRLSAEHEQGVSFGAKRRAKSSESGRQSAKGSPSLAAGNDIDHDYDTENRPVQLARGPNGDQMADNNKSHGDRKRRRRSHSASRLLSSCFNIPNFASSIVHHHSASPGGLSSSASASSSKKTSILSHFRLGGGGSSHQQHKNDHNKRPLSNSRTLGNLQLAAGTQDQNNNQDQDQDHDEDEQLRQQAQQNNQNNSRKHVSFENQRQMALAAAAAAASTLGAPNGGKLEFGAQVANGKRQNYQAGGGGSDIEQQTFKNDELAAAASASAQQQQNQHLLANNVIMKNYQAPARQHQDQRQQAGKFLK